jgi:hypothetical protein
MSTQTDITEPAAGAATIAPRAFARYLRWLTLPVLAFYLLPFLLLRIPGFENWGGSTFGPALNFGFQSAGQNADIVIFGDSSASIGIDASQMTRELGLKTILLPNTGASLPVTNDLALHNYLQHNKPPRLIVFYFAAWDLDYAHGPIDGMYEGEEMLVANATPGQLVAFTRQHPIEILLFPFRFYGANPTAVAIAALKHQHRAAIVADALGHFDPMPNRSSMAAGPCIIANNFLKKTSDDTARRLIQTYASSRTKVLFYLAPIPTCTNAGYYIHRTYDTISAAPPLQMAPTQFKADGSYTHVVPAAVPQATEYLTNAVRMNLRGIPAPSRP